MTGQLGGSAVPRRSSRVRGPPLDPTTLYSVRHAAGDHDASCASDARLPGGWDHSFARLAAHRGASVHHPPRKARSTGLTGRPCFEVSGVPLETDRSDQTALRTTPSGITPAVASLHSAINSLRASATIIVFLTAPLPPAVRSRYHRTRAASGWNIRKRQANWIRPQRTRGLPALPIPFSRRFEPLSSGVPVRPA